MWRGAIDARSGMTQRAGATRITFGWVSLPPGLENA